jgi:hypothetical protein
LEGLLDLTRSEFTRIISCKHLDFLEHQLPPGTFISYRQRCPAALMPASSGPSSAREYAHFSFIPYSFLCKFGPGLLYFQPLKGGAEPFSAFVIVVSIPCDRKSLNSRQESPLGPVKQRENRSEI